MSVPVLLLVVIAPVRWWSALYRRRSRVQRERAEGDVVVRAGREVDVRVRRAGDARA